uniref:Uncharacterized protein n=1 Tax=Rhizophora mucronata TaxID=61149 RepID=A0A2P2N3V7_RHIMU
MSNICTGLPYTRLSSCLLRSHTKLNLLDQALDVAHINILQLISSQWLNLEWGITKHHPPRITRLNMLKMRLHLATLTEKSQ